MSATTDPVQRREGAAPYDAPAAALWQRVAARLVDHVGLAVALAVILVPLGLGGFVLGGAAGLLASAVAAVVSAAATVAYFGVLESRIGQTLGKRLLGVRVVDEAGGMPAIDATLRRNAWTGLGILSVVPVVGGLAGSAATLVAALTILLGVAGDAAAGRGWHDKLAGTRVVDAR